MKILALLVLAVPAAFAQQVHHGKDHPHPHHHRTAEEWAAILEDGERGAWQMPDRVVEALGLEPGQAVADIGAGSGYFAVRLARAVGPLGKVYANDIQQDLIEMLAARAKHEDLPQMTPVLGAPDDPKLPAGSVDLVFICNVVHHIEDRQPYYEKLALSLRPGGRLAIVDFHKRDLPVGPKTDMKISKSEMIAELERAGFSLAKEFDFLPYQYFLIFERS